MDYKVKTYEEAVKVIEEIGLLPLAPLIPAFPSLNSITEQKNWHSDTEFDPWIWRTKFSADGIAGYGKFMKKKSVLVSHQLLPYVKKVLGHNGTVEERYFNGNVSREAYHIYKLISQDEGIDTRALRVKAGLKEKENKKIFENALLELQGSMDIVISGIQEKRNSDGEKNGWSSTAFETYDSWTSRYHIETISLDKKEAKEFLLDHFSKISSNESVKKFEKIFA
ncbi:AlkZ-related protein [Ferdinandcohnia quinoae]|uniref:Uncharacterized protein n=1 Tax=Fredinandcohnia quinoae TaxID=2918902 RepID=A0AAW5E0I0_9BACI|nr:hypothetical protein [Fredinandcohnia sp. SECRCQ15]MCH1624184.1 hypothetical protein [Fredinandcohnia sp. SECRCQ15]